MSEASSNWAVGVSVSMKSLQSFTAASKALKEGTRSLGSAGKQATDVINRLSTSLNTQVRQINAATKALERSIAASKEVISLGQKGTAKAVPTSPSRAVNSRSPVANYSPAQLRRELGIPKNFADSFVTAMGGRRGRDTFRGMTGVNMPTPTKRDNSKQQFYSQNQVTAMTMMRYVTQPLMRQLAKLESAIRGENVLRREVKKTPTVSRAGVQNESVSPAVESTRRKSRVNKSVAPPVNDPSLAEIAEQKRVINKANRPVVKPVIPSYQDRVDAALRSASSTLDQQQEKAQAERIRRAERQAARKRRKKDTLSDEIFGSVFRTPSMSGGQQQREYTEQRNVFHWRHDATSGPKFRNRFDNALNYGAAAGMIYAGAGSLRNSLKGMADFEEGMIRIRKVLNPIGADVSKVSQAAREMGKEFGVSITEVASGMEIFAQQGAGMNEILRQTRVAVLATNVTELSLVDATEALTAAQKQFNLGAQSSMRILDAWNEVENTTSVNTTVLTEALKRAGTASRVAGLDFDSFNGIVAAVGEATRKSGDEIGTAMKFIFQHMRDEGAVEALQQIGIFTEDATGNFKSAKNVLAELSKTWNDLTDAQRQNVAVSIAGTRHLNDFFVMMDTYERAVDISVTSLMSNGSAMRENQHVMSSLNKQVEQLKASWSGLWAEVGQTGVLNMLKGMVQTVKQLVELFNQANGKTGGLISSIAGPAALAGLGVGGASFFAGDIMTSAFGYQRVAKPTRKKSGQPDVNRYVTELDDLLPPEAYSGGRQTVYDGEARGTPYWRRSRGYAIGSMVAGSALKVGYDKFGRQSKEGEAPTARDTAVDMASTAMNAGGIMGMISRPGKWYSPKAQGKFGLAMMGAVAAGTLLTMGGQAMGYARGADPLGATSSQDRYQRLNAIKDRISTTTADVKEVMRAIQSGEGREDIDPSRMQSIRDAIAAINPEFAKTEITLDGFLKKLAEAPQMLEEASRRLEQETANATDAIYNANISSPEVKKAFEEAKRLESELKNISGSDSSSMTRRMELRGALEEQRIIINDGSLRGLRGAAMQRGRAGTGLQGLDIAQAATLNGLTSEDANRYALEGLLQGATGMRINVNRQLSRAGVSASQAQFYEGSDGKVRRISDNQEAGDAAKGQFVLRGEDGDFSQAALITKAKNLNSLMSEYERSVDILIRKNYDMIDNADAVGSFMSGASGYGKSATVGSTVDTENLLRRTETLSTLITQGAQGFQVMDMQDPRRVQNRLLQTIGDLRLKSQNSIGISPTGLLEQQANKLQIRSMGADERKNVLDAIFKSGGGIMDQSYVDSLAGDDPNTEIARSYKYLLETLDEQSAEIIRKSAADAKTSNDPELAKQYREQAERTFASALTDSMSSSLKGDSEEIRKMVTEMQSTMMDVTQNLAADYASNRNRYGNTDTFLNSPEASGRRDSVNLMVKTIQEMVTLRRQQIDDAKKNNQDTSLLQKDLSFLEGAADSVTRVFGNLKDQTYALVAGIQDLDRRMARTAVRAGSGAAFGMSGMNLERFAKSVFEDRQAQVQNQLTQERQNGNYTAIRELEEELRSLTESIHDVTKSAEAQEEAQNAVSSGLKQNILSSRIQGLMGLGIQGDPGEEYRQQALGRFRNIAESMAGQLAPALGGGSSGMDAAIDKLRPILDQISSVVGTLRLDESNQYRQQYLTASPSERASADYIKELIRQGASAEEIFADPYAAMAGKSGDPLISSLMDMAMSNDSARNALRLQEESVGIETQIRDLLKQAVDGIINPARSASGLPATSAGAMMPSNRFKVGTESKRGTSGVDREGRIRHDWTPAYLDKGEIVLNRDQSDEWVRRDNRFARGSRRQNMYRRYLMPPGSYADESIGYPTTLQERNQAFRTPKSALSKWQKQQIVARNTPGSPFFGMGQITKSALSKAAKQDIIKRHAGMGGSKVGDPVSFIDKNGILRTGLVESINSNSARILGNNNSFHTVPFGEITPGFMQGVPTGGRYKSPIAGGSAPTAMSGSFQNGADLLNAHLELTHGVTGATKEAGFKIGRQRAPWVDDAMKGARNYLINASDRQGIGSEVMKALLDSNKIKFESIGNNKRYRRGSFANMAFQVSGGNVGMFYDDLIKLQSVPLGSKGYAHSVASLLQHEAIQHRIDQMWNPDLYSSAPKNIRERANLLQNMMAEHHAMVSDPTYRETTQVALQSHGRRMARAGGDGWISDPDLIRRFVNETRAKIGERVLHGGGAWTTTDQMLNSTFGRGYLSVRKMAKDGTPETVVWDRVNQMFDEAESALRGSGVSGVNKVTVNDIARGIAGKKSVPANTGFVEWGMDELEALAADADSKMLAMNGGKATGFGGKLRAFGNRIKSAGAKINIPKGLRGILRKGSVLMGLGVDQLLQTDTVQNFAKSIGADRLLNNSVIPGIQLFNQYGIMHSLANTGSITGMDLFGKGVRGGASLIEKTPYLGRVGQMMGLSGKATGLSRAVGVAGRGAGLVTAPFFGVDLGEFALNQGIGLASWSGAIGDRTAKEAYETVSNAGGAAYQMLTLGSWDYLTKDFSPERRRRYRDMQMGRNIADIYDVGGDLSLPMPGGIMANLGNVSIVSGAITKFFQREQMADIGQSIRKGNLSRIRRAEAKMLDQPISLFGADGDALMYRAYAYDSKSQGAQQVELAQLDNAIASASDQAKALQKRINSGDSLLPQDAPSLLAAMNDHINGLTTRRSQLARTSGGDYYSTQRVSYAPGDLAQAAFVNESAMYRGASFNSISARPTYQQMNDFGSRFGDQSQGYMRAGASAFVRQMNSRYGLSIDEASFVNAMQNMPLGTNLRQVVEDKLGVSFGSSSAFENALMNPTSPEAQQVIGALQNPAFWNGVGGSAGSINPNAVNRLSQYNQTRGSFDSQMGRFKVQKAIYDHMFDFAKGIIDSDAGGLGYTYTTGMNPQVIRDKIQLRQQLLTKAPFLKGLTSLAGNGLQGKYNSLVNAFDGLGTGTAFNPNTFGISSIRSVDNDLYTAVSRASDLGPKMQRDLSLVEIASQAADAATNSAAALRMTEQNHRQSGTYTSRVSGSERFADLKSGLRMGAFGGEFQNMNQFWGNVSQYDPQLYRSAKTLIDVQDEISKLEQERNTNRNIGVGDFATLDTDLSNAYKRRDDLLSNSGFKKSQVEDIASLARSFQTTMTARAAQEEIDRQRMDKAIRVMPDRNADALLYLRLRQQAREDESRFVGRRHVGGPIASSAETRTVITQPGEVDFLTGSQAGKMFKFLEQQMGGQDQMTQLANNFMGVSELGGSFSHSFDAPLQISGTSDMIEKIANMVTEKISQVLPQSQSGLVQGQRVRRKSEVM